MTTTLSYGKATTCLLDSAEVVTLRPQQQEPPIANGEIAAAVRAALCNPLGYPPLPQATIPGDRVAVAIGPGVPQLLSVLDGVLLGLRDAGVEGELTTLVLADATVDTAALQADLVALEHTDCQIKLHDPNDEDQRSFLGVTQTGQAIRLNRDLCDADFVLPITATQGVLTSDRLPVIFSGLFPEFSDRETLDRLSTVSSGREAVEAGESSHVEAIVDGEQEIVTCGRQLGVGMTMQVVPAQNGQVAEVFAGDPATVTHRAQASYRRTWYCETELRGALVIATLTGDADQQTWANIGRAVVAAEAVLEAGGVIAICSELAELPGEAFGHLVGGEDPLVIEREIQRSPSADSGPALQICRALDRGSIYLRSELRPQVVESLGLTPLESDTELDRLAQSLRPCLVLEESQKLLPTLVDEGA